MRVVERKIAKMQRGAQTRMWAFLAFCLLFATMLMVYIIWQVQHLVESQTRNSLSSVCTQNAHRVESEIGGRLRTVEALATRLNSVDYMTQKELAESMADYGISYGFYNLGVYNEQGIGYTTLGETYDAGEQTWFRDALAGKTIVTTSTRSQGGQFNQNIFAVPMHRPGTGPEVLTATYLSKDFMELLNLGFMSDRGNSVVLNGEGIPISVPYVDDGSDEMALLKYIGENRDIAPHGEGQTELEFTFRDIDYIAYCTPIDIEDWYVLSYLPEYLIYEEIRPLRVSLLMALAWLFLCISLNALGVMRSYRKLSARLINSAYTDELTQARNFEYLKLYFRTLTKADCAKRYLVVFDIDKFKYINILYGAQSGDALLQYIIRLFREVLPDEYIYKGNSDAFVAVMIANEPDVVRDKIERFNAEIARRIENEEIYPFTLSYGICRMDKAPELRNIYDNALLAKKESKNSVNAKYRFYDSIEKEKVQRGEVEGAFALALKNHEFEVWYQPKYDMRNHSICGAEALVRWRRPDGSMMPPGQFIPVLEENGRIVELDEEVLRIVCADLKEMQSRGLHTPPVSVNLSKMHLRKAGVVDVVDGIVSEAGIDKGCISFEITESAIFGDRSQLNKLVLDLQERGFLVDMDDYGTGSSTLTSLSSTNFDTLKLDKSFIDHIGTEKIDIILRSTIQLARSLNMKLVAEGVENETQANFLLANQCYVAQGYYFSRPLPKATYEDILRKWSRSDEVKISV